MSYDYRIKKTAAVAKIPLFGKFDVNLTTRKIENLVKKYYNIVPGSLKFEDEVQNYPEKHRAESFINFFADNIDDPNEPVSGSIIIAISGDTRSIRSYAYIRIDG